MKVQQDSTCRRLYVMGNTALGNLFSDWKRLVSPFRVGTCGGGWLVEVWRKGCSCKYNIAIWDKAIGMKEKGQENKYFLKCKKNIVSLSI